MLDIDHNSLIEFRGKMQLSAFSRANSMSWSHKSAVTAVALPEAKHINGLVADAHSHFSYDILDKTEDRFNPTA